MGGHKATHRSAQISSMVTRMGGRRPTSSRSTGTGEPPLPLAARLRPGSLFASLRPHARRQSAFLHVQCVK